MNYLFFLNLNFRYGVKAKITEEDRGQPQGQLEGETTGCLYFEMRIVKIPIWM